MKNVPHAWQHQDEMYLSTLRAWPPRILGSLWPLSNSGIIKNPRLGQASDKSQESEIFHAHLVPSTNIHIPAAAMGRNQKKSAVEQSKAGNLQEVNCGKSRRAQRIRMQSFLQKTSCCRSESLFTLKMDRPSKVCVCGGTAVSATRPPGGARSAGKAGAGRDECERGRARKAVRKGTKGLETRPEAISASQEENNFEEVVRCGADFGKNRINSTTCPSAIVFLLPSYHPASRSRCGDAPAEGAHSIDVWTSTSSDLACARLAMDSSPEPTPPPLDKKCTKVTCKNRVSLDSRYAKCESCRAANRLHQRGSRAKAKANANATNNSVSKKRKRASPDGDDNRTTNRPRTDQSDEDTRDASQEDSDDMGGENSDDDMGGEDEPDNGKKKLELFADAESFYDTLRAECRTSEAIDFERSFTLAVDALVSPRQRVAMVAAEMWKVSGYRFTVKYHDKSKTGHRTWFWCCQDKARKKKSKASHNPDIRNRDNVGMKRYPCGSKLSISCRVQKENEDKLDVTVRFKHAGRHVSYEDVSMPAEALGMIRDNVEWLTPVAMVTKVQAAFPQVTAAQIHRAWLEMSEPFWRFDNDQLLSVKKLLEDHTDDISIFEPRDVPEGVEMVCWGMKKVATPLQGRIVEIGVDATYNTNSKHLELYSIMGEYEGAGFPLSYLLLSTASSMDQGKRTRALTAWAKCVRDTFNVIPTFTHVDKDMAEIGMLKDVWNAKISLCWWHLRRAVHTRLKSAKLATTPYDPHRAYAEFSFIDVAFVPMGQTDQEEYEGGLPDIVPPVVAASQQPCTMTLASGLRITLAAPRPLAPVEINTMSGGSPTCESCDEDLQVAAAEKGHRNQDVPVLTKRISRSAALDRVEAEKENEPAEGPRGTATRFGRVTKPPRAPGEAADPETLARAMGARTTGAAAPKPTRERAKPATVDPVSGGESEEEQEEEQEQDNKQGTRRTFCPSRFREPILKMMEKHYCAHPLLPGYAHPSPEGIRRWAVCQMYKFCVEHELREVWAYLWENWYRRSRWELWVRSAHPEIPVLKTTMILESHWRRIKHDFLHHFHMPRCDLLAWILITKLAPSFYRKLDRLLTDTGRYRELPSWRKDFKREWRELERRPITLPVNPAYKTDAKKMLCTCPSLPVSRFLLCKHVVQGLEPVPPVFFLEVKRQRTAPFWVHPSLRPLSDDEEEADSRASVPGGELMQADAPLDGDDDDDGNLVDTQPHDDRRTFVEAMDADIDLILEFAKGLKYQRQFRDQRMLQTLEREGASFLRLARACLAKEKRLTSTRGEAPSTWDKSTASAMFYRARPAASDNAPS
ncbi:hypothetical protein K438DRAFT_1754068 [Mycena galopus ATCC 62051]|nr:hypothetical protein K438DRAFT_1754068 [Mycena galopus ATCC 62051]